MQGPVNALISQLPTHAVLSQTESIDFPTGFSRSTDFPTSHSCRARWRHWFPNLLCLSCEGIDFPISFMQGPVKALISHLSWISWVISEGTDFPTTHGRIRAKVYSQGVTESLVFLSIKKQIYIHTHTPGNRPSPAHPSVEQPLQSCHSPISGLLWSQSSEIPLVTSLLIMFLSLWFACNIQSRVVEGLGLYQSGSSPRECFTS